MSLAKRRIQRGLALRAVDRDPRKRISTIGSRKAEHLRGQRQGLTIRRRLVGAARHCGDQ